MQLYGTTTSPFVRRVRIVAAELGEPIERIDTATDAGQAALREVSPIRKVPVAIVEGAPLFDSLAIIDELFAQHGRGPIVERPGRVERNLLHAIDAALDATIQLFYLRRDGIAIDGTPYAERQLARADAIFDWLANQLNEDGGGFGRGLGLAEISLVCAIDWMEFRDTYPLERVRAVEGVRAAWSDRASFVATRPSV